MMISRFDVIHATAKISYWNWLMTGTPEYWKM